MNESLVATQELDGLQLCRCGHLAVLHGERGCGAGRYRPCACLLDSPAAVLAARSDAPPTAKRRSP